MSIYLNKINDFNKLSKIVKSIDGYNNPYTAIKITKTLISEMMKNIKDNYEIDDDRLEDIKEELKDNVLTKNKKYFINQNNFNDLIESYNNTIKELKQNKKRPNFYDDEEELDFPDSEDVDFEIVDGKKFKSSAKAVKIVPNTNISHIGMYMHILKRFIKRIKKVLQKSRTI